MTFRHFDVAFGVSCVCLVSGNVLYLCKVRVYLPELRNIKIATEVT